MGKSTLKDRLNETLALRGKKAVDLMKDLDIPKSAVSQYLSGKSQNMDADRLQKIAVYLDVSEAWLMGFDVPQPQGFGTEHPSETENKDATHSREAFAANLRLLMTKKKKTRKEVSEAIGVSYFTFSDWCNGKKYPRIEKLEVLADYFGVSVPVLIDSQSTPDFHMPDNSEKIESVYIEDFGERLLFAFNHSCLTQAQLASATGITKSSISRYLQGEFEPKPKAVIKLAKALNVSEKWLLGCDDTAENEDEVVNVSLSLEKKAKEEVLDIILRLHTDAEFLEIIELVASLDDEKKKVLKAFLSAFSGNS